MPEVQARRLVEMMRERPPSTTLEVCLPPLSIKKSTLEKLEEGDLLLLPIEKMEVLLLGGNRQEVVARALYGLQDETPSVLILPEEKSGPNPIDTKKYNKLKIVVGSVEQKRIEEGKILPLQRIEMQDAALYRDDRLIAYARLQHHHRQLALHIEEVK